MKKLLLYFLPFCLFTFLPLKVSAQYDLLSAKKGVIKGNYDSGSIPLKNTIIRKRLPRSLFSCTAPASVGVI